MSKCALIVDDSRTAQHALAVILAANGLRVESASSAEEALELLAHSRPDVIFMDHQMPGMDGLQAVKVIKANPATATIPIMMYTSQEGELYVGQARALGALGVLPKDTKPVEVSALLRSLRLVEQHDADEEPLAAVAGDEHPEQRELSEMAPDGLELWVRSLLAIQAQELRDGVQDALAEALREHGRGATAADTHRVAREERRRSPLLLFLVLALAVIVVLLVMLNLELQREWRLAVEGQTAAAQSADMLPAPSAVVDAASPESLETWEAIGIRYLEPLEWAVNQAAVYPHGSDPFDDRRMELLRGLVDRLTALGFEGTVWLDGHAGEFCEVAIADGQHGLAPADSPAEQCSRTSLPAEEAMARSARQSIAFANYLAARAADPLLHIELRSWGATRPAVPYPATPYGLRADEWNAIARQNNRVHVSLQAMPMRTSREPAR